MSYQHDLALQVIYIAPLKALVRERMDDWGAPGKFCQVRERTQYSIINNQLSIIKLLLHFAWQWRLLPV